MNTTVKGGKIRRFCGEVRALTGGKSTPTDQVAPLKNKLTTLDLAIKALPASEAPSAAKTKSDLGQSHADLKREVGLLSPASDKSVLAPYELRLRKLDTDTTSAASFVLEYDKAVDRERSLVVLNRPGLAYQAPVRSLIDEADGLAAQGKFGEAVTRLKLTDTLAKNQTKAASEQSETALKDARLKPLYDNKIVRIQRAIEELAPLPGTAAARKKLAGLITAGDLLARPGNYKAAYDALEGSSDALEAGHKAAREFSGKVGDPAFRKSLAETQQNLRTYAEVLPLTTPEIATGLDERLNRLLQAQDTTPPPTDLTAAKSQLATIGQEISDGLKRLQGHAQNWTSESSVVDNKVGLVRISAPTDVYESVLASYRACNTQHGLRNNEEAVAQLRKLNLRCNELLLVHDPLRSRWDELSKTVETDHFKKLQAAAEQPEFELRQLVNPLLAAYINARTTVPNTHDFKAAAAAAAAVIDQMPRLVEPLQLRIAGLKVQREEGARKVAEAEKALQEQIDALAQAGGDVSAARLALTTGSDGWTNAARVSSLSSALDDALRLALKTLKDATEVVRRQLATPAELTKSKDARLAGERKAALEKATTAANQPLKRLLEEYPDDAQSFVDLRDEILRLATVETTASRPVMQRQIDQMTEVARQAQARLDKLVLEARAVVELAGKAKAAALQRVKVLKGKNGDFATFFKELEAEVQDAAAMADSSVHKVVQAGLAQLSTGGAVFERLTELESATEFERVDWLLNDIDTRFDNDALKTCKPVLLKTLKKRLKEEVKPSAYAQSPEHAVTVLGDFRQEVSQAQTDADKAAQLRLEIATLKGEARQALAGLPKSDSPKVWAMLNARLKAAAKVTEGRELESKSQLTALKVTLGRLTSGAPGVDNQLVEMERQIATKEFNDKRDKAQLEAKVDLFDKNEAREAETARDDTPTGSRDLARYAEIGRLRKEVTQLTGKGQYAEALQRLASAVNEARDFIANPFNAATSSRKNLKAAGTKWASAVSTFVGKLNDLGDAIDKQSAADLLADPQTDLAPYTAAAKAIDELALSFNPEHFTGVIEGLTREGLNLTQVRTAKEAALRLLRGCRDILDNDPVLKQVAVNPFGAPVPLKPLADRLNDLDLNFQRF